MPASEPVTIEVLGRPPTFEGRMLAEAVRAFEGHMAQPLRDELAEHNAMLHGEDFERRVVARADLLLVADDLKRSMRRVRQTIVISLIVATIAASIAGAAAARASLAGSRGEPVNIFWALGGLLGIQTVLLLAWLMIMARGAAALASSSMGGLVVAAARWLSHRHRADSTRAAAMHACGSALASGRLGRWTFSAISHWLWFAFNVACLAMLLAMLSTRHYTFMWETTILGEATFGPMTRAIAFVPQRLGFTAPDVEQIAAGRWPVDSKVAERDRQAWAGLLVGSMVTYGLLPRLGLLAWSMWRLARARRGFRLDLDAPEYARLQSLLSPPAAHLGVIDGDDAATADRHSSNVRVLESRPIGPAAIAGLELQRPPDRWPPRALSSPVVDLGMVDDSSSRRAAIEALRKSPWAPCVVIVVAELTTTPDRGHQSFLSELQAAAGRPITLVLTAGEALRRRGERDMVERRIEDWRAAARAARLPDDHVLELDLDHLTDETAQRLQRLAGDGGGATRPGAARRIEQSFALIAEHAGRWKRVPDIAETAELHRQIAGVYRTEQKGWWEFLRLDESTTRDWGARLHAGANRVQSLLPATLRFEARWLAAGAAAGALGCVAAATLFTPAAIASLPMWSGLGAMISAAIRGSGSREAAEHIVAEEAGDLAHAVRSAALFAMLLELQGQGEVMITDVLQQSITSELSTAMISDAGEVRAWLDELRHRFDLARVSAWERRA